MAIDFKLNESASWKMSKKKVNSTDSHEESHLSCMKLIMNAIGCFHAEYSIPSEAKSLT